MTKMTARTRLARCGVLALLVSLGLIACWERNPAAIEGVIYNEATKQPMPGVYVLATYEIGEAVWFAHSADICTDASGMFTGPDGKYSFPIIKSVEPLVNVAAPNHVSARRGGVVKKGLFGIQTGPGNDIFMVPHGKAAREPAIRCEHARSSEARAANIRYLEILQQADPNNVKRVEGLSTLIRLLQQ